MVCGNATAIGRVTEYMIAAAYPDLIGRVVHGHVVDRAVVYMVVFKLVGVIGKLVVDGDSLGSTNP